MSYNNYGVTFQALRWDKALKNPRATAILRHLLAVGATSPQTAVTYAAIARSLGLHKWQVRRIIAGEGGKRKSLLQGLVHYPDRYSHKGCYLLPEGVVVAQRLSEGDRPTYDDLKALAQARQRRIAERHAESHAKAGESHSHNLIRIIPLLYVCPDERSLKPVNGLAERLWRDYGMALSVANEVVTRYEDETIQAALELRERRNGTVYNPAGFILHLLKSGCAQRYAEAKRARQDPDLQAQKVKEAVEAQTGVKVAVIDGSPVIAYNGGWLHLPLDPDRAVDLVRRLARPPDEPKPDEPKDDEAETGSDKPILGDAPAERTPFRRHKRQCPRCGMASFELPMKVFERRYPQVADAEADRWNGKEVCDKCFTALCKAEEKSFAALTGIDLSEPMMSSVGRLEPATQMPSDSQPTEPQPLRTEKPTAIGDILKGLPLPALPNPTERTDRPAEASHSDNQPCQPTPPLPRPSKPEGIQTPFKALLKALQDAYPQPSSDEPVPCPRCGRIVKRKDLGNSGVCLRCVEDELRRRGDHNGL